MVGGHHWCCLCCAQWIAWIHCLCHHLHHHLHCHHLHHVLHYYSGCMPLSWGYDSRRCSHTYMMMGACVQFHQRRTHQRVKNTHVHYVHNRVSMLSSKSDMIDYCCEHHNKRTHTNNHDSSSTHSLANSSWSTCAPSLLESTLPMSLLCPCQGRDGRVLFILRWG